VRPPRAARILLALSVLLLLAGSAYGALASETPDRTDRWNGPSRPVVVSGYCRRAFAPLPTRSPRPPDFIRFDGRTFVRDGEEVGLPGGLLDTRFWLGAWRLKRGRGRVWLETVGRGTVLPYKRGECHTG
jgi:hypothetical protein